MSGNPKELRHARKVANDAAAMVQAIEALPRRRGSRVRWSNGVVWERYGDDDWRPIAHYIGNVLTASLPEEIARSYPSSHVAQFGNWPVAADVEIRRQS